MREKEVQKINVNITGNQEFDSIYVENCKMVLWTIYKYTQSEAVAEEIMQDVFLNLYDNIEEINMATVQNWLLVVARNQALNWVKRTEAERRILEDMENNKDIVTDESVEESVFKKEQRKNLRGLSREIFQELEKENERWHEAFVRVYCLERPQRQVAEEMNVSIEVLHAMLYRARRWIKRNYQERYTKITDTEK